MTLNKKTRRFDKRKHISLFMYALVYKNIKTALNTYEEVIAHDATEPLPPIVPSFFRSSEVRIVNYQNLRACRCIKGINYKIETTRPQTIYRVQRTQTQMWISASPIHQLLLQIFIEFFGNTYYHKHNTAIQNTL